MTIIRNYKELRRLETFDERFEYLRLNGSVADFTFANERYLNQQFYRSREWQTARRDTIARDYGRDLGIEGYEINDRNSLRVHHMNPITLEDFENNDLSYLLDPEFLITTTLLTHNSIHYGEKPLNRFPIERTPGDTNLW